MRFSTRSKPPSYLGRREQRRLISLIILFGLVVFLMREAAKPANWHWFAALNNPVPAGPKSAAEIDTRLKPLAQTEGVSGEITMPAEKAAPANAAGYFPGVKPELLASVKDDTVFRGAEHEAFFHLLEILHNTDEATLEAAADPAAFVQLYQQPDEYRGRLVTVRGTVRGVYEYRPARNDYGIDHYYQVWIQPYDNPSLPLVAYVLDLPEGFPKANRMQEEAELTGFFFKRWAYRAQDSIRSAPLLLAKTVRWERPAATQTAPISLAYILGIAACALLAAGVVVWMALRGGSSYSGPLPPRRRGSLETGPEIEPSEALRQLAEQATATAPSADNSKQEETRVEENPS